MRHTPSLWKHVSRPISFCLVVDDFGVKYSTDGNFTYFADCLHSLYGVTVDCSGSQFLGITLAWDYTLRRVTLSMPWYIKRAIARFKYACQRARHAPAHYVPTTYGGNIQYTPKDDTSELLSATGLKYVQQVVGALLYYAIALDLSLLVSLCNISAEQSLPTKSTMSKVLHILDYVSTQPDASITYRASDMVLVSKSDTS